MFWRAGGQKAVRKGDLKMIWDERSKAEVLYDMTNQDAENSNIIKENKSIRNEFYNQYALWEQKMINSRWPNVMYYEFVHQKDTFHFPL